MPGHSFERYAPGSLRCFFSTSRYRSTRGRKSLEVAFRRTSVASDEESSGVGLSVTAGTSIVTGVLGLVRVVGLVGLAWLVGCVVVPDSRARRGG